MTEQREPTDLETAAVRASGGELTREEMLLAFMYSRLVVPSGTKPVHGLADLQPLLFSHPAGQMLAVFTHLDRIGEFALTAPFALEVDAASLLAVMPPNAGIVVNVRHELAFEILPDSVHTMRLLLSSPDVGNGSTEGRQSS